MNPLRVAIIGAGPIGLEMALAAAEAGHDPVLYESGRVGTHLRAFEEVLLFTPFAMNSTPRGRERLAKAGAVLPEDDAILTAGALVARYLEPMAALPELRGRIEEGARVTQVARDGVAKGRMVAADGIAPRGARPFLLRIESPDGERYDRADTVIDATGVLAQPLEIGAGGTPALGEATLGDVVDRVLPPFGHLGRARFAGRRVLLVGSGHSAATALLGFAALVAAGAGPERVVWVARDRRPSEPFPVIEDDPLVERRSLAVAANRVARTAPWIEPHPGSEVVRCERIGTGGVRALLSDGVAERTIDVDRVLALVGYRPDTDLFRELRVHLCYASEGPMALAAALQADSAGDAAAPADCLAQTSHGPESLRTTEPGFYVVGAKSYGRNNAFLLRVGHRQVEDVLSLLGSARRPSHLEAAV